MTPNASDKNNGVASATISTLAARPLDTFVEEQKRLFKPASGTGSIGGKVPYDEQPAANNRGTLSEKFSTIFGPSGKKHTARTNKDGIFVGETCRPNNTKDWRRTSAIRQQHKLRVQQQARTTSSTQILAFEVAR